MFRYTRHIISGGFVTACSLSAVVLAQEAVNGGPQLPTTGGVPWAVASMVVGSLGLVIGVLFWQLRGETAGRLDDAKKYADAKSEVNILENKVTALDQKITALTEALARLRR